MNKRHESEFVLKPQDEAGDPSLFQRLLAQETVPVPEFLKPNNPGFGNEDLPVTRYTSSDFHRLEAERMWTRTWQFVGRAEQIPNAGDHLVYDIIDRSVIVMRGDDGVMRGFHNSCLHRGRALRTGDGCVGKLKCPYHGFTWNLRGGFESMPCAWDFKHLERESLELPQVRVDSWAGFMFVNFDAEAPSLIEYLDVLPEHFKDYLFERAVVLAHVRRRIPCNWKVAQEAFMESMHTRATHPQIMTFTGCADSQYDMYGDHLSRSVTPMGVVGPHLDGVSEARVLRDILEESGRMADSDGDAHTLPEGTTARKYIGELNRELFGAAAGADLSQATLAELEDAILYSIFPNTQIWAGFGGNIVYRVIPDGDAHESCLFDVMILGRHPADSPCPLAARLKVVPDDEPFSSAPELGALGPVFDQDMRNLPYMQKGMKASAKGAVSLANYQESRIRHHHLTLDKYLGLGGGK
jgi:phenylpropionate dioxygenase-like ring-hydroxylating dioxygenase large terminal subunit